MKITVWDNGVTTGGEKDETATCNPINHDREGDSKDMQLNKSIWSFQGILAFRVNVFFTTTNRSHTRITEDKAQIRGSCSILLSPINKKLKYLSCD